MGKGNVSAKMKQKNGQRKKKVRKAKVVACLVAGQSQKKDWVCPNCFMKNESQNISCWWCDRRR